MTDDITAVRESGDLADPKYKKYNQITGVEIDVALTLALEMATEVRALGGMKVIRAAVALAREAASGKSPASWVGSWDAMQRFRMASSGLDIRKD